MSTMEIRYYSNRLAGHEAGSAIEVDDIGGQFVAEDARIREIRLCPFESMQIGSADADPPDLQDGLTLSREGRIHLPVFQFARSCTNQ